MAKLIRTPRPGNDTTPASVPPLPPNASVGKRWKFRRNVVMYVAHRAGISQRMLAEVFDLPRSRVGVIVKEMSELVDHRESPV